MFDFLITSGSLSQRQSHQPYFLLNNPHLTNPSNNKNGIKYQGIEPPPPDEVVVVVPVLAGPTTTPGSAIVPFTKPSVSLAPPSSIFS